ncbi:Uncharacterized protein dnm_048760 [Desulfonema magnum]|uniref:Uncharacterized protein n=1 Tax=Desulfonema magnum TaxID=45655 RepID=A0A975GPH1_9BACT|nr:Uncharacterized protein dnm_048760 [Desulfonema magnum]
MTIPLFSVIFFIVSASFFVSGELPGPPDSFSESPVRTLIRTGLLPSGHGLSEISCRFSSHHQ